MEKEENFSLGDEESKQAYNEDKARNDFDGEFIDWLKNEQKKFKGDWWQLAKLIKNLEDDKKNADIKPQERLADWNKWRKNEFSKYREENYERTHLENANLRGAHLENAELIGAHLENAKLRGAHLEKAELIGAHLENAELRGAHLEKAELIGAHLENAKLRGAHLEKAELIGAHLEKADLSGADLRDAEFSEETILDDARLFQCRLEWSTLKNAENNLDKIVIEERQREWEMARNVYLILKTYFANEGMYDAAREYFYREKIMEENTTRQRNNGGNI